MFHLLFSECLQLFFGQTITKRIQLFLTNGASTEYLPILKPFGEDGVHKNACHGLCYFHLVIQGWNKYVKPYITANLKENTTCQQYLKTIRYWFKSWFFYVELEIEYHCSKRFFISG